MYKASRPLTTTDPESDSRSIGKLFEYVDGQLVGMSERIRVESENAKREGVEQGVSSFPSKALPNPIFNCIPHLALHRQVERREVAGQRSGQS